MAAAEASLLRVEVACSPRAGVVEIVELQLPAGSTLHDAIERSGLAARDAPAEPFAVGVWGRRCAPGDAVHDGDRIANTLVDSFVKRAEQVYGSR